MTTCRRFYRESGEFSLCVNIGKKDYVLAENPIDSNTIFYYGIKGIGKLGTMFSEDHVLVREGEFVDVRSYLHKFRREKNYTIKEDRIYILFFSFFSLILIFSFKIIFISLQNSTYNESKNYSRSRFKS